MKKLLIIIASLVGIITLSIFGVGYYGFKKLFPAFNQPNEIKLGKFYNMRVTLTHKVDNKSYNIDVGIGCGSRYQQALGDGASSYSIRTPNLYGADFDGAAGVIIQTPDICGRNIAEVVPDNFLPMILYTPKSNNHEFAIGYFSHLAYEQEFSKLEFDKAIINEITQDEYEKWKDNGDQNTIKGDWISPSYYPADDIRSVPIETFSCYSLIPVPIPDNLKEQINEWWPEDRPEYWVLETREQHDFLWEHFSDALKLARKSNDGKKYWGRDNDGGFNDETGTGIYSRNGGGGIDISQYLSPNASKYFGEALRIPFRTNTGYYWLPEEVKNKKYLPLRDGRKYPPPSTDKIYAPLPDAYEFHITTAGGADKGFSYCYREMISRLSDPDVPADNNKLIKSARLAVPTKYLLNGEVIIESTARLGGPNSTNIIKENNFFFYKARTRLDSQRTIQNVR